MKMNKKNTGFTLIELMIVVSILSILATMALPSFMDRTIRAQVQEAFNLAEIAQTAVEDYFKSQKRLPETNASCGLPVPDKIIGNYVTGVKVINGAIDISLGNRINKYAYGKTITIRPAIVEDSPIVPIAWISGYASVPEGMTAMGENNTDIIYRHLPMNARY
jgi:type IV pilus assembly protein PilA